MNCADLALNTICTGSLAALATTAAVAVCGELEKRNPIAPLNAVSHIAFGDEAANHDEPSVKFTATGAALNTVAVTSWAALSELIVGENPTLSQAIAGGVAVSALAYFVDYHVVPKRLTPGFEKHLSGRSLFWIYATLAMSLAGGPILRSRMTNNSGSSGCPVAAT